MVGPHSSCNLLLWSVIPPFRNTVCPICERSFLQPERGRKRVYCGDACQQAAYRARLRTFS